MKHHRTQIRLIKIFLINAESENVRASHEVLKTSHSEYSAALSAGYGSKGGFINLENTPAPR